MDENSQPNNQPERPSSEPPKGVRNSTAADAPATDADMGAQSTSSDTSVPPESGAETSSDAQASRMSNVEGKSKRPNKAKAESEAGAKNKKASKGRAKRPQQRAKTRSTDEQAAKAQRGAEETGSATSAADDGLVAPYIRGCSLQSAPPMPAGTLPGQLGAMLPDMLAVAAALATTAVVVGQNVKLGASKSRNCGSLALRVASVGEERFLSPALVPVLEAAYALERQELLRWNAEKQKMDLLNVADVARHRLHRQTLANAGLLGLELQYNPSSNIAASKSAVPRPRIVLRNPALSDVRRALAETTSGILLIDDRRLPSLAGFGVNYDGALAAVVNDAAAGNPLELVDLQLAGSVRMRAATVSVIGALSTVDVFSLYKAGAAELTATIFAPLEDDSKFVGNAGAADSLAEILERVRKLTTAPPNGVSSLRFSAAARKALDQVEAKLSHLAANISPPLADYYATVPDLVRRVASILHVLDQADRGADHLPTEVGREVAGRASVFIEQCVLPVARNVLAAASVDPALRDARRILSYAQWYCGPEHPVLQRRDVVRIFQRSMAVPAVDQAIRRLCTDGLLTVPNSDASKVGSHVFQVDPAVFDPKNRLPDLVTDPRRPKL